MLEFIVIVLIVIVLYALLVRLFGHKEQASADLSIHSGPLTHSVPVQPSYSSRPVAGRTGYMVPSNTVYVDPTPLLLVEDVVDQFFTPQQVYVAPDQGQSQVQDAPAFAGFGGGDAVGGGATSSWGDSTPQQSNDPAPSYDPPSYDSTPSYDSSSSYDSSPSFDSN